MCEKIKITIQELRSILTLSAISALRMTGIFMILPILTIYAMSLKGSNEYLIGVSIGIYGIMQVIFQLPFGLLSDKIGRKPVIIFGLIMSALGTEIAALANGIWDLIFGRALQGTGAIGSVLIALLLDSVREQYKTQAMATLGISFGLTFAISMVLGPFIASKFGLHGLFQTITLITILSIMLVVFMIPSVLHSKKNNSNLKNIFQEIKLIITHASLLKLNSSIFCLHTVLILNFIVWPSIIVKLGYESNTHYQIYAIIVLFSILIAIPCIFLSKKKKYKKKILNVSINILFLSELIMFIMSSNCWFFLLGMQLFFVAFNLIESILPSLINKESPEEYKGATISIYSMGQFFGVGLGGVLGGYLFNVHGTWLVFSFALVIALINIKIKNALQTIL